MMGFDNFRNYQDENMMMNEMNFHQFMAQGQNTDDKVG